MSLVPPGFWLVDLTRNPDKVSVAPAAPVLALWVAKARHPLPEVIGHRQVHRRGVGVRNRRDAETITETTATTTLIQLKPLRFKRGTTGRVSVL
jgi:hypothetical protein